jgi:hypothetical protein
MFSLIYGLWKQAFSKTEFHVLILGVHKAWKTVILSEACICVLSLAPCVPSVHGVEFSLYLSELDLCRTGILFLFWPFFNQYSRNKPGQNFFFKIWPFSVASVCQARFMKVSFISRANWTNGTEKDQILEKSFGQVHFSSID